MKKSLKKLFIITLLLLLPLKVSIAEVNTSISLSCTPSTTQSPSEVNCFVKGTSDTAITSIEATIEISSGLEVVSFTPAEITNGTTWQGSDVSNNKLSVQSSTEVKDAFDIGTLKLKVKEGTLNGTQNIKLTSAKYMNGSTSNDVSSASADITIQNYVPKGLKSLTVTGGSLYQETFSNINYDYIVMITGNTFSITAIPINEGEAIVATEYETGNTLNLDNITFKPQTGKDTMMIVIKVGSGETETTYELNVQKEQSTTLDNSLSSLTVGGKTINLVNNQDNYTITLDNLDSYQIEAILKDPTNFKFDDINNGSGTYSGENVIPIQILPKDSSTGIKVRTYTITVKKTGTASSSSPSGNITNPQTGNIFIFIISLILIASLTVTLTLFKKNIENYK